MVFTVYDARFTCSDGNEYYYVGMTEDSLVARRRRHLAMRKGWLQDMVESSLSLRTRVTCNTRMEALAQEAIAAAHAISSRGEDSARGGPWCLSHLRPEHRREIKQVSGCQSAADVYRAAPKGGDLWKHLNDKPYRGQYAVFKKEKKAKPSGNLQRVKRNLGYWSSAYQKHKYGVDPGAEVSIQQTYNATRPNR